MRANPFVRYKRGFTLVEMLVVIGIMALLLGLIVPVFTSVSQGNNLNVAGQDLSEALIVARDQALTNNRKVNVRLLKVAGTGNTSLRYRAAQVWIVKDDQGTMVESNKILRFPTGVILSELSTLSPLLQTPPAQTGTMKVAGTDTNYVSFYITANGLLDGTISNANSYLTLVQERDVNLSLPANFFSLFVNPVTGEVTTYRP